MIETIRLENEVERQDARSLFDFIGAALAVLWKDWPRDMEVTILSYQNQYSLTGTCPHCRRPTVLAMPTNPLVACLEEPVGAGQSMLYAILRCSGCKGYILGIVLKQSGPWIYRGHYPLGTPDDTVAEEIPTHIQPDFKEALRCRFVDAYNATVEMCRRAIQAACLHLGAPDFKLEDQIDWLASQQKITAPLQQMAHKVRLGGNRGAHPPVDPQPGKVLLAEHADAVIEFTKQFFHHVYVMPALLDKYDFSKSGTSGKAP